MYLLYMPVLIYNCYFEMVLRHRALSSDEIMNVIVIITKIKIKPSFLVPYGERESKKTLSMARLSSPQRSLDISILDLHSELKNKIL